MDVFCFPSHSLLSSPFCSFSLPPYLVVTQTRGHIVVAGSLLPPPHYNGSCLSFLSREDFSSFFPRRLAWDCAYPRYRRSQHQLVVVVDPFFCLQIIKKLTTAGFELQEQHYIIILIKQLHSRVGMYSLCYTSYTFYSYMLRIYTTVFSPVVSIIAGKYQATLLPHHTNYY